MICNRVSTGCSRHRDTAAPSARPISLADDHLRLVLIHPVDKRPSSAADTGANGTGSYETTGTPYSYAKYTKGWTPTNSVRPC